MIRVGNFGNWLIINKFHFKGLENDLYFEFCDFIRNLVKCCCFLNIF